MLLLLGCARTGGQSSPDEFEDDGEEEIETEEDSLSDDAYEGEGDPFALPHGKSLNEIRFQDFDEKDWYDNYYFRALRRYLDVFNNGQIEDEELEPYRAETQGQFAVLFAQPYMGGGMLIHFVFIDHPERLYRAHVYSDVDVETEKVLGYYVAFIKMEGESFTTKEELLKIKEEHPENKLW